MHLAAINPDAFSLPQKREADTNVDNEKELKDALDAACKLNPNQGMELMRIALFHAHQRVSKQEWYCRNVGTF